MQFLQLVTQTSSRDQQVAWHNWWKLTILQVSMMLVRTTLGIPLPLSGEQTGEMSDESSTDASQGSSAILSELDRQDSFAPETPPQNMSLLGSEITSRCRWAPGMGMLLQSGFLKTLLFQHGFCYKSWVTWLQLSILLAELLILTCNSWVDEGMECVRAGCQFLGRILLDKSWLSALGVAL